MGAEKILTLHPRGRQGVNMPIEKYEKVKWAIIGILKQKDEITFNELVKDIEIRLGNTFNGSIPWHTTTVKLDLEARNIITSKQSNSVQKISLNSEFNDKV